MNSDFFLKSPTSSFIAKGNFVAIDTPAADAADINGKFQTALKSAFDSAIKSGINKPIVVGAIPFDPNQKSALYIPESYHQLTKNEIDELVEIDRKHTSLGIEEKFKVKQSMGVPHDVYTNAVAAAVEEIKANKLEKVVLSRTETIQTEHLIDSKELVARLLAQNPNGYNFHLPLPNNEGVLAGSSPELILRKDGQSFYSQPLAGSAARGKTESEEILIREKLMSSKKDRHEHKLVVDWMREVLKPVSSLLDAPSTPHTINTPKLWHLATSISGKVNNNSENSLSLAGRLHPTPALSGFPHDVAHDLLIKLEPFNRGYFGGIVGYSDMEGNGEWFIAIRCLQFHNTNATLFAGAGIVKDSDPESEWHETAVKLTTMESLFK